MPMTPGERILTNWMAETGNGMVRHGPKLSAAIDMALDAKDLEIVELKKSLVSNAITTAHDEISNVLYNSVVGECKHCWQHYRGDLVENCKWCGETQPAARDR